MNRLRATLPPFLLSLLLAPLAAQAATTAPPITYTIRIVDREAHLAEVAAVVPCAGADTIELFLPVWSPGFYRVENYHQHVDAVVATAASGNRTVEQPQPNRWRVDTRDADTVTVNYRLRCNRASVTGNQVTQQFAVFCGPATFMTIVGGERRPYQVQLELPADWPRSATALRPAADGGAHHYQAPDYDWLLDSPIVAGTLRTTAFAVLETPHELVDFGDLGDWDSARAAANVQPIAAELCRLFGTVPFARYVFLNGFRGANGGLEHLDSTLISTSRRQNPGDLGWLSFVAHEYAHAFNVKRLRPIGLGPFDYEHPPETPSLWISEGLTTWLGELAVARAGIAGRDQWLGMVSGHIRSLQSAPGRKLQTLADASLSVWKQSTSGVGGDPRRTISYYVKGPVVGFLLDAKIRKATDGKHSLDDVMRVAFQRWSGERGFRPEEFEAAAAELAGIDLQPFFAAALRSTGELDYGEALEWYGLQFAGGEGAPRDQRWSLQVRPEATAGQQARLAALLAPTPAR